MPASSSVGGGVRHRRATEYDHLLKVILVGDEGAGKSSLMQRYTDNVFQFSYVSTIGVDFKIRTLELDVDDVLARVKVQMWDTAGQERFHSITSSFYRGADAVVVVYDVGCTRSFQHTAKWLNACTSVCEDKGLLKVLVGNKADLALAGQPRVRRLVTTEEGEAMAMEKGMLFYETSAKDDHNVGRVFEDLTRFYVQRQRRAQASKGKSHHRAADSLRNLRRAEADATGDGGGCWARLLRMFSARATGSSTASVSVSAASRGVRAAVVTPSFAH